jgi:hypothetical protein
VIVPACMVLLVGGLIPHMAATSGMQDCIGQAKSSAAVARCERESGHSPHQNPPDVDVRTHAQPTYETVWLRSCSAANPKVHGAAEVDCAEAHSCPDSKSVSMTLWLRETATADGRPVDGAWAIDHVECRPPPTDIGVVRRQLGWMDVLTAVRRIGLPPNQVHAPHFTLVNLATTFYTRPHSIDKTFEIIGYSVHVHLEPVTYTWHWGDGTSQTTDTPGRPYPATDITHTYLHATDPGQPLTLGVDTTYQGRYRVDTNTWTTLPQPITIPGLPTPLPIKQASAVLISNN